jgi:two-component sensor histidine kinase
VTLVHDASTAPRPIAGFRPAIGPALGVVTAWLVVGLLSASQYSLAAQTMGQPGRWGMQLLREIPPWQIWSLLTPLVFFVAGRFPLVPGRLLRSVPVHLLAGFVCALAYLAGYAAWMGYAMPDYDQSMGDMFLAIFRARFNVAFILYGGLVGVHHAIWHFRQMREREIEAAQVLADSARARADAAGAHAGLARARLQALRSQLQPHFLFNTLHSIASLMDEDVPTARRLIARLSDLLRTTFEIGEATEVTLAEEIEFLERYLDIERVRFGPRLSVQLEIAPDARAALLPPLLLQPLVENAIRHGIAPLEEGGAIHVRAFRDGTTLALEIVDTGRGFGRASDPGSGNGLRITRERLEHTYGAGHTLRVEAAAPSGVAVLIRLPWTTRDAARAAIAMESGA